MEKLALFGGSKTINKELSPYNTIGEEEIEAVQKVMKGGILSAYLGKSGPGFLGGEEVRRLERQAQEIFGVRHAIAVNSWTSGLVAAVGAIAVEPGDEIITTPWTMAATATCILHWNAIPIFADIDERTFNICPKSVEAKITDKTRAIIVADIFGQSADIYALRKLAEKYELKIISDTAQAPGSKYGTNKSGTLADIGGFSLNYHKHIHCGEGGILVTNDSNLAKRMQLIRNHAEAVIDSDQGDELCNMLGYNFRLGEIEAAIAQLQLKKLETQVKSRQRIAALLNEGLASLEGLKIPYVAPEGDHAYYVYGLTLETEKIRVSRRKIIEALRAEGVPALMEGYANIHLLPIFKNKVAYGTKGFPWNSPYCTAQIKYERGLCPVAEKLHEETFFGLLICMNQLNDDEVNLIVEAFKKVWRNLEKLRI